MAVRQYVGARYVPIFVGEWDATMQTTYEPLSIVTVANVGSYTSKKYVPVGIPITDTDYWVLTANLSGQLTALTQRVEDLEESSIRMFATAADLIASDLAEDSYAAIDNYNVGDGAQALFIIASTYGPNDIYLTLASGLYAIYQHLPYHDLRSFGLVDDPVNDQSALFDSVMGWVSNCIVDGGNIRILTSTSPTINGDYITLQNVKLYYNSDINYFLHFDTKEYVVVDHVYIEKKDASFVNYNRHIRFENCETAIVKNSSFKNYGTAVHALNCSDFTCDSLTLKDVCNNVAEHFGYGIDTSSKNNVITNIYIENQDNSYGRHALYVNDAVPEKVFVDNFNVKNWHHNTMQIKCTPTSHDCIVKIVNCSFDNAMDTSLGGGTAISGVITIANVVTNTYVTIENILFKNCLYAGVDNSQISGSVDIKNIKFHCQNVATIMHRPAVIYCRHDTSIEDITVFNFNDNLDQVFWLEDTPTVDINDVVVYGTSTKRMIGGANGNVKLGTYDTVTPQISMSAITVTGMMFGKLVSDTTSVTNVTFFKQGKTVLCNIKVAKSFSNETSSNPVFTVPAGYRPVTNTKWEKKGVQISIDADGTVYPTTPVTATNIDGSFTWVTPD